MAKLTDLLAQKATLEKQIADAQREERSGAIAQIKALMAEHGLTAADLTSRAGTAKKTGGSKVAAKYRIDPDRVYVTGMSMGGMGTWSLAASRPGRFAAIVPIWRASASPRSPTSASVIR